MAFFVFTRVCILCLFCQGGHTPNRPYWRPTTKSKSARKHPHRSPTTSKPEANYNLDDDDSLFDEDDDDSAELTGASWLNQSSVIDAPKRQPDRNRKQNKSKPGRMRIIHDDYALSTRQTRPDPGTGAMSTRGAEIQAMVEETVARVRCTYVFVFCSPSCVGCRCRHSPFPLTRWSGQ